MQGPVEAQGTPCEVLTPPRRNRDQGRHRDTSSRDEAAVPAGNVTGRARGSVHGTRVVAGTGREEGSAASHA